MSSSLTSAAYDLVVAVEKQYCGAKGFISKHGTIYLDIHSDVQAASLLSKYLIVISRLHGHLDLWLAALP
jgi:hypothetical protein